ncbi:MAG: TetR/AcrR family transcriptional regulator [Bryobacteraceae bacterium]|nr:TetR/AcrR family transcriptional regulator [Bryobacteraceae bacterium]
MTRTKQDVVAEFRCSEILEAARKTFAVQGFAATTMDAIAEQAHIAKGTLYLYFPSKRDIYLAALRQGIRSLNDDTTRKVAAKNGVLDKLRTFVTTRVEYFEQNREFFLIYHSEIGNFLPHPGKQGGEVSELYLEQAHSLESILREAAEQGEVRDLRPDSTAFAVCDLTRGVIVQRMLGWSKAELQDDIDHLIDVIWRGIAA